MLWFGTSLEISLTNSNNIREYGDSINDNPFKKMFSIKGKKLFTNLDTTGITVNFDAKARTLWEQRDLTDILLTEGI